MLNEKWLKNRKKAAFYIRGVYEIGFPKFFYFKQKKMLYDALLYEFNDTQRSEIAYRVNYYNKLYNVSELASEAQHIGDFSRGKSWAYYIDMKKYLKAFESNLRFLYMPGDVRSVPDEPTFLKSRPIGIDNTQSVLLKLNRIRHYFFVDDPVPFNQKKNLLVWRGACHKAHRQVFVSKFYDHPLCNVGNSHPKFKEQPWHRGFMSIVEQLDYKFILSIEGNDVATNLKWIMGSNSLCFMTRPKYETWFMEGKLIPGYHYVELKEDYSDLEDKIQYYTDNPKEARFIVSNANAHVKSFMNYQKEHLIGLLVLQKYFEKTDQIEPFQLGLWN